MDDPGAAGSVRTLVRSRSRCQATGIDVDDDAGRVVRSAALWPQQLGAPVGAHLQRGLAGVTRGVPLSRLWRQLRAPSETSRWATTGMPAANSPIAPPSARRLLCESRTTKLCRRVSISSSSAYESAFRSITCTASGSISCVARAPPDSSATPRSFRRPVPLACGLSPHRRAPPPRRAPRDDPLQPPFVVHVRQLRSCELSLCTAATAVALRRGPIRSLKAQRYDTGV